MIHQRVGADVHHIALAGLHAVERVLVALRFGAIRGDERLALAVVEHQTETGIGVDAVLADVLDAIVVESLADQ